jgi:hypothetical protein
MILQVLFEGSFPLEMAYLVRVYVDLVEGTMWETLGNTGNPNGCGALMFAWDWTFFPSITSGKQLKVLIKPALTYNAILVER